MNKKNAEIKKWLLTDEISDITDNNIDDLISRGQIYIESSDFNRISIKNIVLDQIKYIPLFFWIVQLILLSATVVFISICGYLQIKYYYIFTFLAIIIPFLVLLGAKELSKSYIYNMWEIEQSSRSQLEKITVCRMLIIGIAYLFIITSILIVMKYFYNHSFIGMILYLVVPFNISCSAYLFAIINDEKSDTSYHLTVCTICLTILFSLILRQQYLFEISMIWIWGISYFITIILLIKLVKKYLKHEKMIGELTWN